MALMKVEDALSRLLAKADLTDWETVPLNEAMGRVTGIDLAANRHQPPFNASAMDGYAVKAANIETIPAKLQVVAEVAAGHSFDDELGNWEAVRIFTGAPVPAGADTIVIQENTERDGPFVSILEPATKGQFIRPIGLDFEIGDRLIKAKTVLTARHIALAASMNHAQIMVQQKPKVAILATGDELVLPGEDPSPSQIIASNSYGIAGQVETAGGESLNLGIARDDLSAITSKIQEAEEWGADILVTIGGASVGDHDLVQDALKAKGIDLDFWRIAMRPGKPLMAGSIGKMQVLGLPGNPVSSMVCAQLFLQPLIRHHLGLKEIAPTQQAKLGAAIGENDQRQDYIRATLSHSEQGTLTATPFSKQDSSMLATFTKADALIIRPPFAPAAQAGQDIEIINL